MKKRTRLPTDIRYRALLAAAVRVHDRLAHITRQAVAAEAGVSPGLVSHYLGSVRDIRRAVVQHRRTATAGEIGAIPAAPTNL